MSKYTDRIKELRKEMKLTQAQLAIELGLSSPSRLRMWESGASEPSIDMLVQIAEYFQVSVDYLISRTNQRNDRYSELMNKLSSETANTYRLFILNLNRELVKWENHPLISGRRASSYLRILSHELWILMWIVKNLPECSEIIRCENDGDATNNYTLRNQEVLDIVYAKQQLEIRSIGHHAELQQLLLDNYFNALGYMGENINPK